MPNWPGRGSANGMDLVYEKGEDEGVRFLVVRQHADKQGGWHTNSAHIGTIVTLALDFARHARRETLGAMGT